MMIGYRLHWLDLTANIVTVVAQDKKRLDESSMTPLIWQAWWGWSWWTQWSWWQHSFWYKCWWWCREKDEIWAVNEEFGGFPNMTIPSFPNHDQITYCHLSEEKCAVSTIETFNRVRVYAESVSSVGALSFLWAIKKCNSIPSTNSYGSATQSSSK